MPRVSRRALQLPRTSARVRKNHRFIIKSMTIEDLPRVYETGVSSFKGRFTYTYRCWDPSEPLRYFETEPDLCIVAKNNDRVAGFALGSTMKHPHSPWKYGYVVWLGVRKAYRRHRVATRLFHELESRLKEQGARILITDVEANNVASQDFFEREGFEKTKSFVWMSKTIGRMPRHGPK